jgi:hypothetical protein
MHKTTIRHQATGHTGLLAAAALAAMSAHAQKYLPKSGGPYIDDTTLAGTLKNRDADDISEINTGASLDSTNVDMGNTANFERCDDILTETSVKDAKADIDPSPTALRSKKATLGQITSTGRRGPGRHIRMPVPLARAGHYGHFVGAVLT